MAGGRVGRDVRGGSGGLDRRSTLPTGRSLESGVLYIGARVRPVNFVCLASPSVLYSSHRVALAVLSVVGSALGLACEMSLSRVLPSLRSVAARRAWPASFSSSALASNTSIPSGAAGFIVDVLNAAHDKLPSSSQLGDSSSLGLPPLDVVEDPVVEDGPPLPPPDGYPPAANPVAAANRAAIAEIGAKKPMYAVSVKATRNNTIVTLARPNGNQMVNVVTLSGGKLGFKKSNRNGYEAGYRCAVGIIGAMEAQMQKEDFDWELLLKGFGAGREAMLTAVTTSVGAKVKDRLKRVTDRTPIKIGGTRGKKARRV
ncbi:hypothetical protein BD414DRAFT_28536 [Trametes punicea]|nr:hypothetical protein BD414DRAFT_28536 [Trametes punicea]